jgi:hypothetical protein
LGSEDVLDHYNTATWWVWTAHWCFESKQEWLAWLVVRATLPTENLQQRQLPGPARAFGDEDVAFVGIKLQDDDLNLFA